MSFPPPLYIQALSDDEIILLKAIVKIASTGEKKLFLQNRFRKKGDVDENRTYVGDIRNFIKTEFSNAEIIKAMSSKDQREYLFQSSRPNAAFISEIYNYVMKDIYKELYYQEARLLSKEHLSILNWIQELYKIGVESERYDRDITFYMNNFISGNMSDYDVAERDRGFYVGYRYITNASVMLRFFVHIYRDSKIDRTRFRILLWLPNSIRETKGFAYYGSGNLYLFGFINNGIGCEFITVNNITDVSIRAGVMVSTGSNGAPAAKQCILVQADRTEYRRFSKKDKDTKLSESEWEAISEEMKPFESGRWWEEIDADIVRKINVEELVKKTKIIAM